MSPCHTVYGDAGNSHLSLLGTHCSRNSDGFLPLALGTLYLRAFFEFNPRAGQNRGAEELIALGLVFDQGWELVDENLSFFASLRWRNSEVCLALSPRSHQRDLER